MKFKNIIVALLTLPVIAGMVACSDNDDYEGRGAWDAADGYAQIYFPNTTESQSVEPEAPATYGIEIRRRAANLPALTAKPTVLKNTDNIFTVSDAVFAEGDTVAYIMASFPDAEIGKEYTLQLTFDDPQLTSIYSSDIVYTYSVIRVKWNLLGTGTMYEDFVWGDINDVEIYQRDDNPAIFRIMNPFNKMTCYEGLDYSDGNQSPYVDITILQKGEEFRGVEEISTEGLVYFTPMNSGYYHSTYGDNIYLYHPSSFTNLQTEDAWAYNKVLVWQDDDMPGRIQLAPYYYIPGIGGWNQTAEDGQVIINFPGYEDPYVAQVEDYDWEEVYDGEFQSEQLGTLTKGVVLYRGVRIEEIEQEDKNCYELADSLYGTIYKIANPYANGYDIVFYLNDEGAIVLSDEIKLQDTGLKAVGTPVYAKINAGMSAFSEKQVSLNITFQSEPDEDGNFTDYGTSDEVLSNIKWNAVATGTYTYSQFFEGDDEGLTLYQREDEPNIYKITDWGYGVDFTFSVDANNEISFDTQYIGYDHPSYGSIYVYDMNALYPTDMEKGYYEDGVYHFNVGYTFDPEAGWFGYGEETFTVTDAAVKAKASKTTKAKQPVKKSLNKAFSFKAKSRSVKAYGFSKGVVRSSKPAITLGSYEFYK